MGGKNGLEAIEKTVIDRAVQVIYRPYLADPRPENMPILSDLHQALLLSFGLLPPAIAIPPFAEVRRHG